MCNCRFTIQWVSVYSQTSKFGDFCPSKHGFSAVFRGGRGRNCSTCVSLYSWIHIRSVPRKNSLFRWTGSFPLRWCGSCLTMLLVCSWVLVLKFTCHSCLHSWLLINLGYMIALWVFHILRFFIWLGVYQCHSYSFGPRLGSVVCWDWYLSLHVIRDSLLPLELFVGYDRLTSLSYFQTLHGAVCFLDAIVILLAQTSGTFRPFRPV